MQSLRQLGSGLLFGLVCVAIIVGGFALSMAEGRMSAIAVPTNPPTATLVVPATSVPTLQPTLISEGVTETVFPATDTPVPTPTETLTPPPPPTSCPPPASWLPTVVQLYDTLPGLAQTYRTTVEALRAGNCLVSDQLVPGSFIYVPPLPTATLIPCGAPAGWITYIVRSGDTLFSISQMFRVTVAELQRANCLGSSTFIQAGQRLKVPNVPTSTPLKSATPSATFVIIVDETATPTLTLPVTETEVPTETEIPTKTDTPVPPSETPPPPSTATPTATTPPTAASTP